MSIVSFTDPFEARAAAIQRLGYSPRQAQFLVLVMLHAGVFVERQYCAFGDIRHGQKSMDFLDRLLRFGHARAIQPGARHRGRLYHVQHKRLYRLIGQADNRHRRPAPVSRLVERLMLLDAVLDDRDRLWLATEQDKTGYFLQRMAEYRYEPKDLPHLTFRSGGRETLRLFPDKLPIAVDPYGDEYVFLYLVTRTAPVDFRSFLRRHFDVFSPLRRLTLRVLVPQPFRDAIPAYRRAAREELVTPLALSETEELTWFFAERRRLAQEPASVAGTRFDEAARRFAGSRFQALYRAWEREGDGVLWNTHSHLLVDAFDRGTATLEFHVLSRPYLHLTHLVGMA